MSVGELLTKEFPAFSYFLEMKRSGKRELFVEGCTQGYEAILNYCQANKKMPINNISTKVSQMVLVKTSASANWKFEPEHHASDIGFVVGSFVALVDNFQYKTLEYQTLFANLQNIANSCRQIEVFDTGLFYRHIENMSRSDVTQDVKKRRKALLELCTQNWSFKYIWYRAKI